MSAHLIKNKNLIKHVQLNEFHINIITEKC